MRDRFTILLFLAGIFAPLVRWVLVPEGDADTAVREQRVLAQRPRLLLDRDVLAKYPERFDAYYRDHFGFRSTLVRWHNIVKWFLLDTSPSASIVKGRDGWLFFQEDDTLDQIRGALPFSDSELEGWRTMLEAKRDWLAGRGIEYLCVFGPTKGVVYPEYLPGGHGPIGPSRLDQLTQYMAEKSDVEVLDLSEPLLAEKSRDTEEDLVFYPLGTHWTHRGALVCSREILRRLQEREIVTSPLPEYRDYKLVLAPGQGDSWAARMYMEDRLTQERWSLVRKDPDVKVGRITGEVRSQHFVREGSALPRAVLYHDSYASLVKPMLSRSFSELTCFWKYKWDTARILEAKPDVVIDMMVERALVTYRPGEELFDFPERLAQEFASSEEQLFELDLERDRKRLRRNKKGAYTIWERGEKRGLHIEIPSRGILFGLPSFTWPEAGDVILRLELTAPKDALVTVLYPTNAGYQFKRSVVLFAPEGKHVAYLRLREKMLKAEGGLRFAAAATDGKWILHAVEVRAVGKAGR